MKFAFFGKEGSYNFHKIGGVDAIIRRLSSHLSVAEKAHEIYLITYGNEVVAEEIINDKITIFKATDFETALAKIKSVEPNHTVVTYLDRSDRSKFNFFQKENKHLNFSLLLTVFHKNPIKRWLAYGQAVRNSEYKFFLCISERIQKAVSKISKRAIIFLPPVDDSFYSEAKPSMNKKFHIGYMGRLDIGKGADLAIRFFEKSNLDREDFEFTIFSYPWKTDSASMAMHEHLLGQSKIEYVESKVKKYTTVVDENLKAIIDSVDVFLLPYRTLSSTIDTPLVPLEILSRNKLFISTSEGIMPSLIGDKKLLIRADASIEELDQIILYCKKNYESIQQKNQNLKQKLDYKTSSISKILTELV